VVTCAVAHGFWPPALRPAAWLRLLPAAGYRRRGSTAPPHVRDGVRRELEAAVYANRRTTVAPPLPVDDATDAIAAALAGWGVEQWHGVGALFALACAAVEAAARARDGDGSSSSGSGSGGAASPPPAAAQVTALMEGLVAAWCRGPPPTPDGAAPPAPAAAAAAAAAGAGAPHDGGEDAEADWSAEPAAAVLGGAPPVSRRLHEALYAVLRYTEPELTGSLDAIVPGWWRADDDDAPFAAAAAAAAASDVPAPSSPSAAAAPPDGAAPRLRGCVPATWLSTAFLCATGGNGVPAVELLPWVDRLLLALATDGNAPVRASSTRAAHHAPLAVAAAQRASTPLVWPLLSSSPVALACVLQAAALVMQEAPSLGVVVSNHRHLAAGGDAAAHSRRGTAAYLVRLTLDCALKNAVEARGTVGVSLAPVAVGGGASKMRAGVAGWLASGEAVAARMPASALAALSLWCGATVPAVVPALRLDAEELALQLVYGWSAVAAAAAFPADTDPLAAGRFELLPALAIARDALHPPAARISSGGSGSGSGSGAPPPQPHYLTTPVRFMVLDCRPLVHRRAGRIATALHIDPRTCLPRALAAAAAAAAPSSATAATAAVGEHGSDASAAEPASAAAEAAPSSPRAAATGGAAAAGAATEDAAAATPLSPTTAAATEGEARAGGRGDGRDDSSEEEEGEGEAEGAEARHRAVDAELAGLPLGEAVAAVRKLAAEQPALHFVVLGVGVKHMYAAYEPHLVAACAEQDTARVRTVAAALAAAGVPHVSYVHGGFAELHRLLRDVGSLYPLAADAADAAYRIVIMEHLPRKCAACRHMAVLRVLRAASADLRSGGGAGGAGTPDFATASLEAVRSGARVLATAGRERLTAAREWFATLQARAAADAAAAKVRRDAGGDGEDGEAAAGGNRHAWAAAQSRAIGSVLSMMRNRRATRPPSAPSEPAPSDAPTAAEPAGTTATPPAPAPAVAAAAAPAPAAPAPAAADHRSDSAGAAASTAGAAAGDGSSSAGEAGAATLQARMLAAATAARTAVLHAGKVVLAAPPVTATGEAHHAPPTASAAAPVPHAAPPHPAPAPAPPAPATASSGGGWFSKVGAAASSAKASIAAAAATARARASTVGASAAAAAVAANHAHGGAAGAHSAAAVRPARTSLTTTTAAAEHHDSRHAVRMLELAGLQRGAEVDLAAWSGIMTTFACEKEKRRPVAPVDAGIAAGAAADAAAAAAAAPAPAAAAAEGEPPAPAAADGAAAAAAVAAVEPAPAVSGDGAAAATTAATAAADGEAPPPAAAGAAAAAPAPVPAPAEEVVFLPRYLAAAGERVLVLVAHPSQLGRAVVKSNHHVSELAKLSYSKKLPNRIVLHYRRVAAASSAGAGSSTILVQRAYRVEDAPGFVAAVQAAVGRLTA